MLTGSEKLSSASTSDGLNRIPRRLVLRWGLFGVGAALFGQFAAMLVGFAWPKRLHARDQYWTASLGSIAGFRVGDVHVVHSGQIAIARVPEGFLALQLRCTHLGCTVKWEPQEPTQDDLAPSGRFVCRCHGGVFDRYGRVMAGPPPRALSAYPLQIRDDTVTVSSSPFLEIERSRGDSVEGIVPPT